MSKSNYLVLDLDEVLDIEDKTSGGDLGEQRIRKCYVIMTGLSFQNILIRSKAPRETINVIVRIVLDIEDENQYRRFITKRNYKCKHYA